MKTEQKQTKAFKHPVKVMPGIPFCGEWPKPEMRRSGNPCLEGTLTEH